MNRKLKKAIKKSYDIPEPKQRDEFLRSLNLPKRSSVRLRPAARGMAVALSAVFCIALYGVYNDMEKMDDYVQITSDSSEHDCTSNEHIPATVPFSGMGTDTPDIPSQISTPDETHGSEPQSNDSPVQAGQTLQTESGNSGSNGAIVTDKKGHVITVPQNVHKPPVTAPVQNTPKPPVHTAAATKPYIDGGYVTGKPVGTEVEVTKFTDPEDDLGDFPHDNWTDPSNPGDEDDYPHDNWNDPSNPDVGSTDETWTEPPTDVPAVTHVVEVTLPCTNPPPSGGIPCCTQQPSTAPVCIPTACTVVTASPTTTTTTTTIKTTETETTAVPLSTGTTVKTTVIPYKMLYNKKES